jgi:AraC family transcriptional regulator
MSVGVPGKSTLFDAFLRGPSSRRMTSYGLNWKDSVVEEHSVEAGERPETISERYILGLWCNTVISELTSGRGHVPHTKRPGIITFVPPGIIPAVRQHNRFELILCGLEPTFVNDVEGELEQRPGTNLPYRTHFRDARVVKLMTLLAAEAREGGPLGRLYADHLAHALAMWLLLSNKVENHETRGVVSPLPRRPLDRVLERMRDLAGDLDLRTLAAESGYSRNHFLRMFEVATGYTPHRYLLRLRLERAEELMGNGCTSLIDIAAACGFSSHSHMSRVFRQMSGVTPSEYRRNLFKQTFAAVNSGDRPCNPVSGNPITCGQQ